MKHNSAIVSHATWANLGGACDEVLAELKPPNLDPYDMWRVEAVKDGKGVLLSVRPDEPTS